MKILQIGKYYYPSAGGIETVLRNLAEGLRERKHEVTVLCSAESAARSEEVFNGVRVIRVPRYGQLLSQPLNLSLASELRELARAFDLVHIHSPNPLAEMAALSLPARTPLAVTYHSDIVRQRLVLPLYAPILRRFLRRADRVVVATPNPIRTSPFLSAIPERCEVVPFGIRDAEPAPEARAAAEALRREHGDFALFVGRLVGYKGIPVLLEALREVDCRALIIGTGPLRAELEARARELGVHDKARFLGFVPDGEARAYFDACRFMVLPSISTNEAFGMVQLEAMAAAKPSLVSRLDSGVTQVNEDGVSGIYFAPGDAAALARAMKSLLGDAALTERMGREARRIFEERFTHQKMVDGYLEIYERLLAGPARPRA